MKEIQTLKKIKQNFKREIRMAATLKDLNDLKVAYLGRRQGILSKILKSLKDMPLEKRRKISPSANQLKKEIEKAIREQRKRLALAKPTPKYFDITVPGRKVKFGRLHPLTKLQREVQEIFTSLGFEVVAGPEVETEFNNFDALNIPPWHPAREMFQTFWLKGYRARGNPKKNYLLRTHTSPVQIRYLQTHQPPLRIIAPGRCFRYEATDATHNFQFYQLEGLMVSGSNDPKVTLATFKAIIELFLNQFFKNKIQLRFLPSYFPFVEPGIEVQISCINCNGRGCNLCRKEGWLELLGAGMVHPHVFEAVGYNPNQVQGFAFGVGLDRLAMIKYKLDDIRRLYGSDIRFLEQF